MPVAFHAKELRSRQCLCSALSAADRDQRIDVTVDDKRGYVELTQLFRARGCGEDGQQLIGTALR